MTSVKELNRGRLFPDWHWSYILGSFEIHALEGALRRQLCENAFSGLRW